VKNQSQKVYNWNNIERYTNTGDSPINLKNFISCPGKTISMKFSYHSKNNYTYSRLHLSGIGIDESYTPKNYDEFYEIMNPLFSYMPKNRINEIKIAFSHEFFCVTIKIVFNIKERRIVKFNIVK
jgi:hypothetical protein